MDLATIRQRAMEAAGKEVGGLPACPRCDSQDLWRHGVNRAGSRQWLCKTCGRVFVVSPYVPEEIIIITDRLLQEQVPVAKIAAALQGFVSRRWIYNRRESLNV